jgi:hypothetical protein
VPHLTQWNAQTSFDFFLVIATGVEATALVAMYRLERAIERARSDVHLITRIQIPLSEAWAAPRFWIVNGSEHGCHVEEILLGVLVVDAKQETLHALMDGPGFVLKPFDVPREIDLGAVTHGVAHVLRESGNETTGCMIAATVRFTAQGRVQSAKTPTYTTQLRSDGLCCHLIPTEGLSPASVIWQALYRVSPRLFEWYMRRRFPDRAKLSIK